MDQLTDDELRAEHRRATLLGAIAENAGEADAADLYASVQRAIEYEMRERKID
jgi:hypothetical protein